MGQLVVTQWGDNATTKWTSGPQSMVMRGSVAPNRQDQARLAALSDLKSRLFENRKLTFGRYEAAETIGRGGFGVVFRAHDPELRRDVAVKVLTSNSQTLESLMNEARAVARLNNPNVVSVHDVGRCNLETIDVDADGEGVFIVMELVEGPPLSKWLQDPHPMEETLAVFRGAGEGLAAAHASGLIHRDFKPANVLIDERGIAKVADFGLAMEIELTANQPLDSKGNVTATDYFVGTPMYVAPEVLTGSNASARSDQYSYCVALRAALGTQRFFDAQTMMGLWNAKQQIPPWEEGTRVPRRLRRVIDRGMSVEPAARWPDMPTLLHAIEAASRPSRRWLPAAIGSVLLLGGAAAATVWLTAEDDPARASPTPRAPRTDPVTPAIVMNPEARAALEPRPELASSETGRADPTQTSPETGDLLVIDPDPDEHEDTDTDTDTDALPIASPPGRNPHRRRRRSRPRPSGEEPSPLPPEQLSDLTIRRAGIRATSHCAQIDGMPSVDIRLTFDTSSDGKITGVRVREPYTNGPIGRCVREALGRVTLPTAQRGRRYEGTLTLSRSGDVPAP